MMSRNAGSFTRYCLWFTGISNCTKPRIPSNGKNANKLGNMRFMPGRQTLLARLCLKASWNADWLGRNGFLSQMYHNGHGLTAKRLRALTVIHNYGIKRLDGTTAAMRLFDQEFPDLFSWMVNEMGELLLPRKSREPVIRNPLFLITVPC